MNDLLAQIPENFGTLGNISLNKSIMLLNPPTPICVEQNQTIEAATQILQEHGIGCALAVDENNKLAGIFTERDIVQKWLFSGVEAHQTKIADIMTADPATLSSSSTIASALYVMSKGGFRHIPIVNADNSPAGIISVKDVMDFIAMEFMKNMFNA